MQEQLEKIYSNATEDLSKALSIADIEPVKENSTRLRKILRIYLMKIKEL